MRHHLDPRNLHVFAATLGELRALGLLRPGEGSAAIADAIGRLPQDVTVDRSGLQARLHHTMRDTAEEIRMQRSEDEIAVRAATIAAVAGKKSSLIVKAVAEGARGSLSIAEAHAIALDQALRELQR